jgi:nicotinamidase-related amidase
LAVAPWPLRTGSGERSSALWRGVFTDQRMSDLHGNAPDRCDVALVLIDVINDLVFPGGDLLQPSAVQMAQRLAPLVARARSAAVPVIYVNDNFGRWRSDFRALLQHCLEEDVPGREIAKRLAPADQDYFVLKPKHSGFYSTTLELLLQHLGPTTLILTGIAAESCVLFTAHDAYLRDYRLWIPEDCVASQRERDAELALLHMRNVLKADTRPSNALDIAALARTGQSTRERHPR